MKIIKYSKYLILFLSLIVGYSSGFAQVQVANPVCEYKHNPIGIDVKAPRISWQLVSDAQNVMQAAYEIRVADSPKNLANKSKQLWATGRVSGSESVNVEYGGPEPKSMQRFYWQVRVWDNSGKVSKWSEPSFWEMGIMNKDEWSASWISMPDEPETEESKPAQYFRKEFTSAKKIEKARIYLTTKGTYQLFINGEKMSPDLFAPGWTTYNKRIQYQTYDVTSMIQEKNAIGVIVGDGWFRGKIAKNLLYGDKLALIAKLKIDYTDGTSEMVTTDNTWKVTTGPILASDIYNGETYDARLEMPGWNKSGFNDRIWKTVTEDNDSKDVLVAESGDPVRAIQEIKPIDVFKTPKGEVVFDMGQNMVGWVRLKVNGNKGEQIVLKFAEVLDKAGNFYTENLRAAECTDTYILKGGSEEVFEPHFTFHGFRFVQIIGLDKIPELNQITGVVIHSKMTPTGTFVCSDSLINQLQHNIIWGQKGNFVDVPTDCPQRNERLGWTGDAQVFCPTAAFNFDVAAFYTKWLKDLAADQLPDGKVPDVIPDVRFGRGGSTAWGDASIVVPWNTYLAYNDERILEEQYSSMKGWVDYMTSRAGDDFLWTDDNHYGDWLAFATTSSSYPGATTEKDLIATAYYKYSSGLLAKIAKILGKEADAEKYAKLSENIKKGFQHEFITPNGRLISHTQTAYSLALSFDLLPEDLISKAAEYLAEDVKKMGHLTTGFVGTPLLCESLSSHGYEDLAYLLLNRKEYPSWLYPVTMGATTIWERWDGIKPDSTFQNAGMNSFNHYAYGAIGEWMYTNIAGIKLDPQNPGYKHFYLEPHPGGGLTNAKAEHLSMYGKISSSWKIEGQATVYEFEIPPNTTATVVLPGENIPKNLGSGKYTFTDNQIKN